MSRVDDAIRAMRKLSPVVDITDLWNECQRAYRRRVGSHYHGPLRGHRKFSSKECLLLIVEDQFNGDPVTPQLNPETWSGHPDYWDLSRVIAIPKDEFFRGRKEVITSDLLITLGPVLADALNAHIDRGEVEE